MAKIAKERGDETRSPNAAAPKKGRRDGLSPSVYVVDAILSSPAERRGAKRRSERGRRRIAEIYAKIQKIKNAFSPIRAAVASGMPKDRLN